MFRSPFSDVEIPDMPLTDFVLGRAGELGDKPALIDGPSGRTITFGELADAVRAVAAGPRRAAGFGKGDVLRHLQPEPPRVRGRLPRASRRPAA